MSVNECSRKSACPVGGGEPRESGGALPRVGRMRVRVFGYPRGARVLWLHGWLGNGGEAEAFFSGWVGKCCFLCPDLPGHGESPLMTLEETLVEIEALARGCLWAGGYSMGGRLLMMAAARGESPFPPLVLESASPGLEDEGAREERRRLDDRRAALLRRIGLEAFSREWYSMPMWGGFRGFPRRDGDEERLAAALQVFSVADQPDLRSWLRNSGLPMLWLAGTRDSGYVAHARWVQAHTRARVEWFDTGHNIHAQAPEAWRHALQRFIPSPEIAPHESDS